MRLQSSAEDNDIIYVHLGFPEQFQELVHQSLKGCWPVGQSKGHPIELVLSPLEGKSGFLSVLGVHPDLVVSTTVEGKGGLWHTFGDSGTHSKMPFQKH